MLSPSKVFRSKFMKKREVSMSEFISGESDVEGLSLITGVSGSGKSYLLDNAKFPKDLVVIDLDSIGAKSKEGKWLTDIAKIPENVDIAVGTSDNLIEVANALREAYDKGESFVMYWVQPSPDLFRSAVAAKAQEASDTSPFKQGWLASSKWSDAKVAKYIGAKLDMLLLKVKPDELVIVKNDDANIKVKAGFHESAAKVPPMQKGGDE